MTYKHRSYGVKSAVICDADLRLDLQINTQILIAKRKCISFHASEKVRHVFISSHQASCNSLFIGDIL